MNALPPRNRRFEIPEVSARLLSVPAIGSGILFLVAVVLLFFQTSGGGILFFLPFTFFPMIVGLLLGAAAASRRSLWTLFVSNLLYFGWFFWVYLSAFYFHPDAQAGLAFLFVGLFSLPVMIPLWGLAWFWRGHNATDGE